MRKEDDRVPDQRLSGQFKSTIHHHRTRRVPGPRQRTRWRSAMLNVVCILHVEMFIYLINLRMFLNIFNDGISMIGSLECILRASARPNASCPPSAEICSPQQMARRHSSQRPFSLFLFLS